MGLLFPIGRNVTFHSFLQGLNVETSNISITNFCEDCDSEHLETVWLKSLHNRRRHIFKFSPHRVLCYEKFQSLKKNEMAREISQFL